MHYVITNGTEFYYSDKKLRILKTTERAKAHVFKDSSEAQALLKTASKKLKSFYVEKINLKGSNKEKIPLGQEPFEVPENSQETEKLDTGSIRTKRVTFTQEQREEVYVKSEGHCGICGHFVPPSVFTIDHIVPLAKGGTNMLSNLQCACKECNLIKQDILPEELNNKLVKILVCSMKAHPEDKSIWKKLKKAHKQLKRKDAGQAEGSGMC